MGCGMNTASSNRPSKTAGSMNNRTTGCVAKILGRSLVQTRPSKSSSTGLWNCVRGHVRVIPGRPSTLIGIPFDRPVVGYGGKTINTLRLWAAAAPDYFDFQAFSSGNFVEAQFGTLAAETLTRVLYPDNSAERGQGLRFVQEYFLSRLLRWPIWCGAFGAAMPIGARSSTRSRCSSTIPIRRWQCRS